MRLAPTLQRFPLLPLRPDRLLPIWLLPFPSEVCNTSVDVRRTFVAVAGRMELRVPVVCAIHEVRRAIRP